MSSKYSKLFCCANILKAGWLHRKETGAPWVALKGRQGLPKPQPGQHGGSLVRGAQVLPGFRRQEKNPAQEQSVLKAWIWGWGQGVWSRSLMWGSQGRNQSSQRRRNSVSIAKVSAGSKLSCCLATTPPALDPKPVALPAPRNLHQLFNSLHQMGMHKQIQLQDTSPGLSCKQMAALSLP